MINRRIFMLSGLLPLLFGGAKLSDRKSQIKVGDRVTNKRLGPKITGIVVRDGNYLKDHVHYNTVVSFDKNYPNWRNENLFIVRLDKPSKPLTLQETIDSGLSQEDYYQCPLFDWFNYPEADLVKLA